MVSFFWAFFFFRLRTLLWCVFFRMLGQLVRSVVQRWGIFGLPLLGGGEAKKKKEEKTNFYNNVVRQVLKSRLVLCQTLWQILTTKKTNASPTSLTKDQKTYRRMMADLFGFQDSGSRLFIACPLGKVLLSEDRVIWFLLHACGCAPRRVGSIQSRDKPTGTVQQTFLRCRSCRDWGKELWMVAPILTIWW